MRYSHAPLTFERFIAALASGLSKPGLMAQVQTIRRHCSGVGRFAWVLFQGHYALFAALEVSPDSCAK